MEWYPGVASVMQTLYLINYRRLHLPVNAPAKNMFSTDVKRLCFKCQTLKFPRPNFVYLSGVKLWSFPTYQWFTQVFLIFLDCDDDSKLSEPREHWLCRENFTFGREKIRFWHLNRNIDIWDHVSLSLGGETSKFDAWNIDVWRHVKTCF